MQESKWKEEGSGVPKLVAYDFAKWPTTHAFLFYLTFN